MKYWIDTGLRVLITGLLIAMLFRFEHFATKAVKHLYNIEYMLESVCEKRIDCSVSYLF